MPKTWKRIAQQGTVYEKAFVTTPLCCPSRASIFTGTLARKHEVLRNNINSSKVAFGRMNHFPQDLRENGYSTALVGKFLNSWRKGWTARRKKEFDFWAGIRTFREIDEYYNFDLQINDTLRSFRCSDPLFQDCVYMTDELAKQALTFLQNATESKKPFLLYFAPLAPHPPATPAVRHQTLYTQLESHRPPSFAEEDLSDKPLWMQQASWIVRDAFGKPILDAASRDEIDRLRLNQLRSLAAVDEAIDAMLSLLESRNRLKNTFVLYTSDNGHFWGEHHLKGKNAPYQESIRVPLAIRFPRLFSAGNVDAEHLIANIDFAPSIYDLAEIAIPAQVEGRSLLALVSGSKTRWRKDLFFEGWPDRPGDIGDPRQCRPPFRAIMTGRFKYVEYQTNSGTGVECIFNTPDRPELYDLKSDPHELNNLSGNPAYHVMEAELRQRLSLYPKVDAPVRKR